MSSSPTTEAGRVLPERIEVGSVLRPHGVRGALLVAASSDNPARFAPGSELDLAGRDGSVRRVRIEAAAAHGRTLRVQLAGVTTRDAAETLVGARFEVGREAVPAPVAGALYHFELVGCRCFDRTSGELGEVVDVVADGGGWLIVVERPDGSRLPLPFVERFLVAIDRAAGRIDWQLPEGLVEACASRS